MESFFIIFVVNSGDQHTAGIDAHHLSGRKIRDRDTGLSDQFFRLIILMDAAQDHSVLTCTVIQEELQKLLALRDRFALQHFHCAEIALAESLEVHKLLKERFDLNVGEVDRLFQCSCHLCIICSLFYCLYFLNRFFFGSCLYRAQCREKQDIADRFRSGKEHDHAVDSVADSAERRHTGLHGFQEVFVRMVRFLISVGKLDLLCRETFSLIHRVIELGVGIRHLPAVHVELKPFHILRIIGFLLCKRRNIDGVIHQEGWLYEMLFCVSVKDRAEDVPFSMEGFILDLEFLCLCPCFFQRMDLFPVNTGILLDGVHHCDPLEGLGEIHLDPLVVQLHGAKDLLSHMPEHLLGQVHHAVVIGICLIQLHHGKLRIVACVDTFIAEYASDLIDFIEPAYDQPLQVQFQRDAQLHILVEGVEMGLKGTRGCAARVVDQHRCLHLHEAFLIEESADRGDDRRAFAEHIFGFRIGDQIQITFSVYRVRIGQAVELFRERTEGFAQELKIRSMDGQLAGLRTENESLHTEDISDIPFLETGVGFLADIVSSGIDLDRTGRVLEVEEGSLPHDAAGHDTSCHRDGHLLFTVVPEVLFNVLRVVFYIIRCSEKRITSLRSHCRQFFLPDRDLLGLGRLIVRILSVDLLCHSILLWKNQAFA